MIVRKGIYDDKDCKHAEEFMLGKFNVGILGTGNIAATMAETVSKMKMHPAEWEKIFVNHGLDKGLISKNI